MTVQVNFQINMQLIDTFRNETTYHIKTTTNQKEKDIPRQDGPPTIVIHMDLWDPYKWPKINRFP